MVIGIFESFKEKFIYEGGWKDDKKNGNGKIKYLNNYYEFEGEFVDDKTKSKITKE